MTDKDFTKELDLLVKFQRLLKEGIDYDTSYYLTYNRYHEDYLKEIDAERHRIIQLKIIGKIEPDNRVGMVDDGFIDEPAQCVK